MPFSGKKGMMNFYYSYFYVIEGLVRINLVICRPFLPVNVPAFTGILF